MTISSLTMHELAETSVASRNRIMNSHVICTGVYDDPYAGVVNDIRYAKNGAMQLLLKWAADGSEEWVPAGSCTITRPAATISPQEIEQSVRQKFETLEVIIKGIGEGHLSGAIVSGPGGVGKTETVERTLQTAMGLSDDQREQEHLREELFEAGKKTWRKVTGHMAPMSLYMTLYENRAANCVTIFDDTDSVFADDKALNLLKAALDTRRYRVLNWGSTSKALEAPQSFRFEGRIIFLTNKVLSGEHFKAMLSRIHHMDMTMGPMEVLYRIRDLIPHIDHHVEDLSMRTECVDFLQEHIDRFQAMNVRVYLKLLDYRAMDVDNTGSWKVMAQHLLFEV